MKKNNIVTAILGMYFALIPILWAFHLSAHAVDHLVQLQEQKHDSDTIVAVANCFDCDFYANQQLYFEEETMIRFFDSLKYKHPVLIPFLHTKPKFQIQLRGPPAV